MRLIDADRLSDVINNIDYVPVCIDCYTKHEILELIDEQPAVIEGKTKDAAYAYQRTTSVKPTEHHYEEPGEEPYIKYGCPVCEAVGNLHQVAHGEEKCPLCGVNLYWGTDI